MFDYCITNKKPFNQVFIDNRNQYWSKMDSLLHGKILIVQIIVVASSMIFFDRFTSKVHQFDWIIEKEQIVSFFPFHRTGSDSLTKIQLDLVTIAPVLLLTEWNIADITALNLNALSRQLSGKLILLGLAERILKRASWWNNHNHGRFEGWYGKFSGRGCQVAESHYGSCWKIN